MVLRVAGGEATEIANAPATGGNVGGIAVTSDGTVLLTNSAGVQAIGDDGSPTLLLDAATAGLGTTPGPITLDGLGNIYLADNDTHRIIRRGTDGALSLIAGSGVAATSGAPVGDGQPAGTAPIGVVTGLAIDPGGNLLFADSTTLAIRRVAADGTLSTVAGGGASPIVDADGAWIGNGAAADAVAFMSLAGLAVDTASRVYVSDPVSGAIVRILPNSTVEFVIVRQVGVEAIDGVSASDSSVTAIGAIAIDRASTLYFEDGASLRTLSVA